MNFTPQQRIDLLNNNGWSKNDVRQLIRDCEELELQLKAIQVQAKVKPEIADVIKSHITAYNHLIKFYAEKYDWRNVRLLETKIIALTELGKELNPEQFSV